MANRFPLIVDATDNKIKELPNGDSLDFEGSGLVNLSDLTLSAALSVGSNATITGTLAVTGATTLGEVTATNLTVGGFPPLYSQTQSDWTEESEQSPAFIANKPESFGVDRIQDQTDLTGLDEASDGDSIIVRKLEGEPITFAFETQSGGGGGSFLTDLSATKAADSGTGSFTYNNNTGEFTVAFPEIVGSDNIGVNINGSGQIEVSFTGDLNVQVDLSQYTLGNLGDVNTTGASTGDVLKWNGANWAPAADEQGSGGGGITEEEDDLQSVTTRGSTTNVAVDFQNGLTVSNGITNIQSLEATDIDITGTGASAIAGSLTVSGNLFTNLAGGTIVTVSPTGGLIALSGFEVDTANSNVINIPSGANITGDLDVTGTITADRVESGSTGTPTLESSSDIILNASTTGRVDIIAALLQIPARAGNPPSPAGATGDMYYDDTAESLAFYSGNADGNGNAGYMYVPNINSPRPLQLPVFTNSERNALTAVFGQVIANSDSGTIQAYNGSNWVNL
jgi:hypothetical protein